MEQKIDELEDILKMILKTPQVKRSNLSYYPTLEVPTQPIKQDEVSHIIKENIDYTKTIQELKEKVLFYENNLNEQQREIESLKHIAISLKISEKQLKNALLQAKGNIRVLCRVKPTQKQCYIKYNETKITIDEKIYSLDHIFDSKSTQDDVFKEMKPEIEAVLEGYNICIFAFGQTGSGKTYTMCGNETNEGMVIRSIKKFKEIQESYKLQGIETVFTLKYLEVYNENITDLLTNNKVIISHDAKGIALKNCTTAEYKDIEEAYEVCKRVSKNRKTGETQCNSNSSRSHMLFIINVQVTGNSESRQGSLCLIDLAGSERLSESKSENERLKETQFINKSLSALGNVIVSLKRQDKHIPFRDSKLTHLMQEYLSGKSRTSMIVHIDPENRNESACSLRFATKVSECIMKVSGRNVTKYV